MTTTETATPRGADAIEVEVLDQVPVMPPALPATSTARTSRVVLHRVDPASVVRLSLVFYACVCAVLLVAGIILWIGASITGVVGNVESFVRDAGFNDFRFAPIRLLRAFTVLGVIIVAAGTAANVLLAMLFNLLSELVGGIRVTLAEDVDPQRGR